MQSRKGSTQRSLVFASQLSNGIVRIPRTPVRTRDQSAFKFLDGYRAVTRFRANGEVWAVLTPATVVQAV